MKSKFLLTALSMFSVSLAGQAAPPSGVWSENFTTHSGASNVMDRWEDGFAVFGVNQYRRPDGEVECRLLQTYENGVWRSRGSVGLVSGTAGPGCINAIGNINGFSNVVTVSRYGRDICIGGNFDELAIDPDLQYFACHGETLGWYQPNGNGNGPNGPVFDISWGGGPLYLTGSFSEVDQMEIAPQSARNVVRTDGFTWEPLWTDAAETGEGLPVSGTSILVPGDGFAYVANGASLSRWNPTPTTPRWQDLGSSDGSVTGTFYVTLFGVEVYFSGNFNRMNGVDAVDFARATAGVPPIDWMPLQNPANSSNYANDGILTQGHGFLYTTGDFTQLDPDADGLVRWDLISFEAAPNADVLGSAATQRSFSSRVQHPLTGELCGMADTFEIETRFHSDGFPCYDGNEWRGLTNGVGNANGIVSEITKFGDRLVAAGDFDSAGDSFDGISIAQWDGVSWSPLDTGLSFAASTAARVDALANYQGSLYAAGTFDTAGAVQANNIARWDGAQWHVVGANGINQVSDMLVWNDQLIIADAFQGLFSWDGATLTPISGLPPTARPNTLGIYRGDLVASYRTGPTTVLTAYDGTQWTSFPGNFSDGVVKAIAEDRDYLYVGGSFRNTPVAGANRIARYDGSTWQTMGQGMDEPGAVTVFADVNDIQTVLGQVFVVGDFTSAGTVDALHFAVWDGSEWFGYEPGLFGGLFAGDSGNALYLDNDTLYIGGSFTQAGNVKSRNIAGLELDLTALDAIFDAGGFGG